MDNGPAPGGGRLRLPEWARRASDLAVLPTDNQETVRTKRLLTGALLISIPTSIISV